MRSTRGPLARTLGLLLVGVAAVQAVALPPGKPLKQFGRQSWRSDTGLPQNTVHAVAQTPDGFLWLATEGGLVRYDGQEFRTFDTSNTPALPGDSIEALAVDGRGSLWVSCAGGLVRVDRGGVVRIAASSRAARAVQVLRDGNVLIAKDGGLAVDGETGLRTLPGALDELVTEDPEGRLWATSGREAIRFRETAGPVDMRLKVDDIGSVQVITTGAHGEVWFGGREGAALFRDGKRVRIGLHTSVTSVLPAGDGEAWLGTDAGLVRFANGRVVRVAGKGIASGPVQQLFRDAEGAVWVVFEKGAARIGAGDRLEDPIELPGVLSVFEDSEGDMWFGTDAGGLTVLREQAFSTLTAQDGLSDDFVRAVFQDATGRAWVGTNRGGLNQIAGGVITPFRAGKGKGLVSNVVLSLAEAGGDLWVGTPDGLNRVRNGQSQLFTTANGLPDDFVRSLYADRDGSLWIGTRSGLSHYVGGRFTSYSTLDGLGSDLVGSILRARDGTLWVGTLGGVSRFDGTAFRNFTRKDGLGGDAITAMTEDSGGTIWIAAHGAGLTRLRRGTFTAVAAAGFVTSADIYSVLEDKTANLWMGTAKGVYRTSISSLNAIADGRMRSFDGETFGVADGMGISECSSGGRPAGWRMKDGSLWFATLKGVAMVNPGTVSHGHKPPPVSIEQVAVDDQVITQDATRTGLLVAAGRERVTFHYAAPSFRAPQKVVFRYMLEGFDRAWIAAGSRRTAYYTNIPGGTYRFLVAASNGDGVWSPVVAEMRIVVRPRFYRTWWFYLLSAMFVAALIYFAYWLRLRAIESRYRVVMGERNRIAREIHDTLAQGYVGVSLQLELVGKMLEHARPAESAPGAAEMQIEATREFVKSSLEEARSSIWRLRSSQADAEAETFPARMAAAVRAKQQSSEAAIELKVTGTFRPLERAVEDEMLRIGQEAISNAVRHASANTIDVRLQYDAGWLYLSVSDDGKGFRADTAAPDGHYGVKGMKERAAAIGAELRMESSPGAGTSVAASLNIAGQSGRKKNVEQA